MSKAVAYSYTPPGKLGNLPLGDVPLPTLANPMSKDQSVMRPLLLPGLLDAARHNAAHGRPAAALFESAHVYEPSGPLDEAPDPPRGAEPAVERHHLAGLIAQELPSGWRTPARPVDFFVAKGLV